jgi:RHS repeat-associated protein
MTFPPADPNAPPGTAGHRIVTYYSACVHATCTGTGGAADTYAVEYALPFSRLRPGDGAGRFLSQEIFEQGGSTAIRRLYANYENDGNPAQSDEPVYANQRPQSSRTFFLDDPLGSAGAKSCISASSACTSVTTDSSDYDGVGHYRLETTSENLGGLVSQRSERTEWNQFQTGPPPLSQPWILDTYTYKQQQAGSAIERQDAFFDAGTGALKCWRLRKSGAALGAHDVVQTYDRDGGGNVSAAKWFGGDTATVSTAGTCPAGNDSPVYTHSHAYASGTRSSTTVQPDSTHTLSLLNLTVDPGTGLPSVSTDPAARPTFFTYDAMGRLLTTSPRGDATAAVTYQLSDTAPPRITAVLGSPSSPLQQETWLLDGLGRFVQDLGTLPGGGAQPVTSSYNALGWKTFVSEPSSGAGTSFQGYDAFGRPALIKHADGKVTQLGYTGIHKATRTEFVQQRTQQTDANNHLVWVVSEVPAITRETYDGFGLLRQVQDATGTLTHYTYDVGGRLNAVLSNASGKAQVRSFQYDGRGFLVREVSPEGGAVSYRYDAGGNLTQRSDAAGAVFAVYDGAGRAVHLSAPSPSGAAKLKDFEYDTSANGTGKLATAHAYNWRSADSCSAPFEVRQDFSYDPGHGRLSQEVTTLLHGSALEQWTQGYGYDGAGGVTQTTYPSCLALCPAAPRTVTTNYAFGRPTSVPGFASPITYSPNGTVATITHQNQVVFAQTPDPTGMARPKALGVQGGVQGSANPWPLENYSYDAAGNITQIGGKSFTYDPDSRLVSAALPSAGAQPYQQYTYDGFGNLTQIASGTSFGNTPTSTFYTADANNHLTGAGYDGVGNLQNFQFSTYLWDPLQQLTDVNTGAETWVHTYDAMGERVWSWRTSPSRIDTYSLRGQNDELLSFFTKSGSAYTWEDYVYREGQLLAAQLSDGTIRHLDVDHLGSVRFESDGGGHQLYYRDLWPYGDEATPPASGERMRFAGHERDLGSLTSTADDIDYMHARYYRPGFGRFLSVDSLGGSAADPQSWNRYAYTSGNPLRYVDPDGLGKIEAVIWLVERIPGGGLKLLEKLFSRKEAADLVEKGADVLAKNQKDVAYKIAEEGGGGKAPIWDPAHGGRGFRPHYHIFGRAGGHVFYSIVAGMTLRHWAAGHGAGLEFVATVGDFFNPLSIPDDVRTLLEHFTPNGEASVLTEEDMVTTHIPGNIPYTDFSAYGYHTGSVVDISDLLFAGKVCVEGVCAK